MIKKSFFLAVAVAFVSFALANPANAQGEVTKMLLGDWKGDAERTRKALVDADFDEDQIEMVMDQIGRITVTFAKDDVFKMSIDDPSFAVDLEGKWTGKSEDGDKLECVIVLEMESAANDKQDLNCKFLEMGEFVHIVAGDEPPIVFKRVKE